MSSENKKELTSHEVEIPVSPVEDHVEVTPEFAKKVDEHMEKRHILLERLSK